MLRPAALKVHALQWLSQREHSRTELRIKLLRLLRLRGAAAGNDAAGGGAASSDARRSDEAGALAEANDPATEVETVLAWLEQQGYVSDARFTESRIHARQARFGNRRIQQELQQHGVVLDAAARQALTQTELARAGAVWQRKYGTPATDTAGRMRQMRFLAGRGFSMDVIRRVLSRDAQLEFLAATVHATIDDGD